MNRIKSLFLFIVSTSTAIAVDENVINSYFVDDAPVVLSATRLKQSLASAPAAITVIDREMIRASGASEIVELFRLVPGMQVSYKKGHLAAASYHGMNDQYAKGMQVLVDGSSIYSASFGGLFWADYPLLIEEIERIEVIRGPAAATYGPNAFQGVINIITSHSSQNQGINARFRAGEGANYRGSLRYGGKWKDLNYRFSFTHKENDGLEGIDDSQDINTFSSRFDYQLSNTDTLQYNLGYSDGKLKLGMVDSLNDPSRYESSSALSHNLRWERHLNSTDQIAVHFMHKRHEKDNDFISDGRLLSNDQVSERFDIELEHTFAPFENTRVVWGLGSRYDRMRLWFWTRNGDDKTNFLYRVFGNVEWKFLENFSLNLGALLEKNSYEDLDVSPKIALNYQWSPHHSFRIMASRASRMPAISEQHLYVNNTVNTIITTRVQTRQRLKPVEAITFEAGHHGQFFNNTLTTDLKIAHQRFRRLTQITAVHFDAKGPILEYGNSDLASSLNYEIQLDYKPNSKALFHLGYSWININHKGGFLNYRESAPHHSLNMLASYKFPQQWQASLGYYYRTEVQALRADRLRDFQRLDFVLRKGFTLSPTQKLELSLIHQNNLGAKDEFVREDRLVDRTFLEISYHYD